MKKTIIIASVMAVITIAALADKPVRVYKTVPAGTNVVVSVKFGNDAVNPTAYDIFGVTNGTCAVYSIVQKNGAPVTNTYVAAKAVASTNAVTNADVKKYLYGDFLLFKFSQSNGGQIWVYGDQKQ